MIFGIGTDLVKISRIKDLYEKYTERFPRYILSDEELKEFASCKRPVSFLAKRFAAKEAIAKALGTGFRQGIHLRQFTIIHDTHGRPEIVCTGKAAELLLYYKIKSTHLTLTDEHEYALAVVVLET